MNVELFGSSVLVRQTGRWQISLRLYTKRGVCQVANVAEHFKRGLPQDVVRDGDLRDLLVLPHLEEAVRVQRHRDVVRSVGPRRTVNSCWGMDLCGEAG